MEPALTELIAMAVVRAYDHAKAWPAEEREDFLTQKRKYPYGPDHEPPQTIAAIIGAHGDVFLYGGGKKGEVTYLFELFVYSVAVLLLQSGNQQITVLGIHWRVTDGTLTYTSAHPDGRNQAQQLLNLLSKSMSTNYPNLPLLGTRAWVKDLNFRNTLDDKFTGRGTYLQNEKKGKTLFELIMVAMSGDTRKAVYELYNLPADTTEFVQWAWDYVAWQGTIAKSKEQNEYYNYPVLYKLFQERGGSSDMVLHYKDRFTDQEGKLILQLEKTR